MRKIIIAVAVASISILSHSVGHAGAAICIAKENTPKNDRTDVEYFVRYGAGVKGYVAAKAARADYNVKYKFVRSPSCKNSGSLVSGYYVIIKKVRKNRHKESTVTYGFGYGSSKSEAKRDAVKHLGNRNWSWSKSEGYEVIDTQEF